ncbi:hypothetical protein [Seonamhaeicola marinus]|uniref:Uncharacterized protein n=1 Tax=Seonamhaeicola marinus TaxID=1912246 RepID=A0A5D0HS70_9FLAO|nr:hypothetical protein [Seonamhaeicola marinus]TYA74203.1 hypothetical protein FUA24_12775 [Seonamhaeicola marinus]
MKGFFTFILFLAFAFRPMYNVGYLAYYELNIDYIIETYCVNKEEPELKCNGKCHLASKLSGSLNTNKEEPSALTSIFEAFVPVYYHEYELHKCLKLSDFFTENNWGYTKLFTSLNFDKITPPPRV